MKKFILKLVVHFSIVMFILTSFVCYRYAIAWQNKKSIFSLSPDQNVIVVGDSHAECSFVETNGIKMLTYHSTPLNVSLMRLLELEKRESLSHVKVIVANLCYTTCSEWGVEGQVESTWRFLPVSLSYLSLIPIAKPKLYFELLRYATRHMNLIPPIVTNPRERTNEQSIDERDSTWVTDSTVQAIERHFGWHGLASPRIDNAEMTFAQTIERLKEFCDRHDIQLVMYSAPLSRGYIDRVPQWGHDNLRKWITFATTKGILYYDYMESCPSCMFRDSDHLSKQGAEAFTVKFYGEVLLGLLTK